MGSVDLAANNAADATVLVSLKDGWVEQEAAVCQGVDAAVRGAKVVAVINMAGGGAGGCTADADWVKNADLMWKQSVWSSAIASSLASRHLADRGLLVLPGAQPCLGGTPGMMGYGMAKAAVHQLVKSLACPGSGLPTDACALGLHWRKWLGSWWPGQGGRRGSPVIIGYTEHQGWSYHPLTGMSPLCHQETAGQDLIQSSQL